MYRPLRQLCALLVLGGGVGVARAQLTEVPDTVAPGHFLLEMDALSLTVDHRGDGNYTALAAATTQVTTGVTDNWDIQLGVELLLSQDFDSGGLRDRHTGLGDVYVRTKWRFYQDAATGTSVAVLPYVKLPTNTDGVGNSSVEGGIIVPWATLLPGDLSLAAMAGGDVARDPADDAYETYWYSSAVVTRPLTSRFSAYGEGAFQFTSASHATTGLLGGGLTFTPNDVMSWDLAVYRGLFVDAPDWHFVLRFNFGF